MQFDHVVVLVNNLDQAIANYQALGFNPFYGGRHADGRTHNALIVFRDGTYLELLAPTDPTLLQTIDPNDRSNFLFLFEKGEGFGGYALLSQNLAADVAGMQARGLNIQMRQPGGRARPDGETLRWRTAMLEGTMTPFFIQDDTPRRLRVTDASDQTEQPNGVTGVAGISVVAFNLAEGISRYHLILNTEPVQEGFTTADFAVGNCTISVIAPANADVTISKHLMERGETPYLLRLKTEKPNQIGYLDLERTHGAFIELTD